MRVEMHQARTKPKTHTNKFYLKKGPYRGVFFYMNNLPCPHQITHQEPQVTIVVKF